MRRALVLLVLSAFAAAASAQDDPVADILARAARENGGRLRFGLVWSRLPPGLAEAWPGILERVSSRVAAAAGAVLEKTELDLSLPLAPEIAERLAGAGARVRTHRARAGESDYEWPFLAHLLIETPVARWSVELPTEPEELDRALVRLVALAALGYRPWIGVQARPPTAEQFAAALGQRTGGDIHFQIAEEVRSFSEKWDVMTVVATGGLDPWVLVALEEWLSSGRPAALFLDPAVEETTDRTTLVAPAGSTGLEALLAERGIELPAELVLDPTFARKVPTLVTREDEGSFGAAETPLAYEPVVPSGSPSVAATRFFLAGPIRIDRARLAERGWKTRPVASATPAAWTYHLAEKIDLVTLVGSGKIEPCEAAPDIALVAEGPWNPGSPSTRILVVRDADFLIHGAPAGRDAIGRALAGLAWEFDAVSRALERPRPIYPPIRPAEVRRVSGQDLELIHEDGFWFLGRGEARRLADGREIKYALFELSTVKRGESPPEETAEPAHEVEIDAGPDLPRVRCPWPSRKEGWVDLAPLPTDLATSRLSVKSGESEFVIDLRGCHNSGMGHFEDNRDEIADAGPLIDSLARAEEQIALLPSDPGREDPDPVELARLGLPRPDVRILVIIGDERFGPVVFRHVFVSGTIAYARPEPWAPFFVAYRLAAPIAKDREHYRMPPPPPPRPDRVRLRQILVAYEGAKQSSATRTKDEARQLAEKLQSELRATPAEFARLAARHSDDPSGPLGGDLGVVREGDLVAELESAAFALSPGEVSDVVETPCGFHVLMRVD